MIELFGTMSNSKHKYVLDPYKGSLHFELMCSIYEVQRVMNNVQCFGSLCRFRVNHICIKGLSGAKKLFQLG